MSNEELARIQSAARRARAGVEEARCGIGAALLDLGPLRSNDPTAHPVAAGINAAAAMLDEMERAGAFARDQLDRAIRCLEVIERQRRECDADLG